MELVACLKDKAETVAMAEPPPVAPPGAPNLTPEAVKLALANTGRTEPAVPFPAAHGYLTLPAGGVPVVDFGGSDGFGGIAHGLSMVTRADADVVAPADGWVMYKGPYLNYGQIVILNPGDDYTILLAGLDTTNVNIGQFVLMGEPVGKMGSRTIGQAVATGAGATRPTLYIELRKNNEPIDPTGWWAQPHNPTHSG
jgi:septal ring factor EnvC (AmiA/AmiB activator)